MSAAKKRTRSTARWEIPLAAVDGGVVRVPRGESRLADDLDEVVGADGCVESSLPTGLAGGDILTYANEYDGMFRACGRDAIDGCARVAMFMRDDAAISATARRKVQLWRDRSDLDGLDATFAYEVGKEAPARLRVDIVGEEVAEEIDAEVPWYRRATIPIPLFGEEGAPPTAVPIRRRPCGALDIPDGTEILRVAHDEGWCNVALFFRGSMVADQGLWVLVDRGPAAGAASIVPTPEELRLRAIADAWFEGDLLYALFVRRGDLFGSGKVALGRLRGSKWETVDACTGSRAEAHPRVRRVAVAKYRAFGATLAVRSELEGRWGEIGAVGIPDTFGCERLHVCWNEGGDAVLVVTEHENDRVVVGVVSVGDTIELVASVDLPTSSFRREGLDVRRGAEGYWMVTLGGRGGAALVCLVGEDDGLVRTQTIAGPGTAFGADSFSFLASGRDWSVDPRRGIFPPQVRTPGPEEIEAYGSDLGEHGTPSVWISGGRLRAGIASRCSRPLGDPVEVEDEFLRLVHVVYPCFALQDDESDPEAEQ